MTVNSIETDGSIFDAKSEDDEDNSDAEDA